MTKQEIAEYVQELLRKETHGENLTVGEVCVLDMHKGLAKTGEEITEADIREIKFMMD